GTCLGVGVAPGFDPANQLFQPFLEFQMPHWVDTLLDMDALRHTMRPLSKCADAPAPLRYTQLVPQSLPAYRLHTLATGARVASSEVRGRPSLTVASMVQVG